MRPRPSPYFIIIVGGRLASGPLSTDVFPALVNGYPIRSNAM